MLGKRSKQLGFLAGTAFLPFAHFYLFYPWLKPGLVVLAIWCALGVSWIVVRDKSFRRWFEERKHVRFY